MTTSSPVRSTRVRCVKFIVAAACSLAAGAFAAPPPPAFGPAAVSPVQLPQGTNAQVPIPPSARWNVAQLQQSFHLADSDGNGQLTRAEAQQLIILPRPFEELDANKDGVL